MIFEARGLLIFKFDLTIYIIHAVEPNGYKLYAPIPAVYWHVPRGLLAALPLNSYIYISPAGSIFCEDPAITELGWTPDTCKSQTDWLIALVIRLRDMLKNS